MSLTQTVEITPYQTYSGCYHCGCPEPDTVREYRGQHFGVPAYEAVPTYCSMCGAEWEPVECCAICEKRLDLCTCERCEDCGMPGDDCRCGEIEDYLKAAVGMLQRAMEFRGNTYSMKRYLEVAARDIEEVFDVIRALEQFDYKQRVARGERWCPLCTGTGAAQLQGKWERCWRCDGTGRVKVVGA